MPKQKRPFVVEIEAKLTVYAFDEDSARKKVEKAFASGRPLGIDVDAGLGVWTYVGSPPGAGAAKLRWRRRGRQRRWSVGFLAMYGQVVR